MRTSSYFFRTLKESPADAQIISHQLMLRAGMIRKLASGIYSWLPMGLRVLRKVETIVREEMDFSGSMEVSMPIVQTAELWQETGRWEDYGAELLRIYDRHNRELVLGPTHEEVITDIVRNEIKSYKQLPISFYQIQTKFRDEIRPRFGIMRGREFLMKDAYSFHANEEQLQTEYENMYATYSRIFDRLRLKYRSVKADGGSIGGNNSHEFHVLADSGEDAIIFNDNGTYAANIEKAEAVSLLDDRVQPDQDMMMVDTPGIKTCMDLSVSQLNIPITKIVKTLILIASEKIEEPYVAVIIRADHSLNLAKAGHLPEVAKPLKFAEEKDILKNVGASVGSLGPVNLKMPCIVDLTVAKMGNFVAGANEDNKHYMHINWDRDCKYDRAVDLRNVVDGDPSPDGNGHLSIKRGIEVGHIFQLGTKYSKAMNAKVLDSNGKATLIHMGCYGIGVSRIVASAIEQNHDKNGIIWPDSIAPFQLVIIPLKFDKSDKVRELAESLYKDFESKGVEILLDDKKGSPGVKFSDMDLIGIPHRLVVSDRGVESNTVEYKYRKSESCEVIPIERVVNVIMEKLNI